MTTREIPRNEWVAFFDSFSQRHEGWFVNVRVVGSDIGAQREFKQFPLVGISADLKDNEDFVNITVGKTAQERMTHTVSEASRVWLKQADNGADEALEIEAKDETKTLLTFRSSTAHITKYDSDWQKDFRSLQDFGSLDSWHAFAVAPVRSCQCPSGFSVFRNSGNSSRSSSAG